MRIVITDTAKVMSVTLAITEYQRQQMQCSGHTMKAKVYDLDHFADFMGAKFGTLPMLYDITRGVIEDFIEARLKIEAPATVSRRLATIKHFCREMAAQFVDFRDQARGVKGPVLQDREPPHLTAVEKEKLRNAVQRADRCEIALRNSILLELGLLQAFRCAEMANLRLEHIDLKKGLLVNFRGKGTKFSTMRMHPKLQLLVEKYNSVRDELINRRFPHYNQMSETEKLCFPYLISLTNAKLERPESFALDNKTIWRMVYDLGQAIGIKLRPHDLRHTSIKDFYHASGFDIFKTAKFARHTSTTTTQLYAASSIDEVGQTMEEM